MRITRAWTSPYLYMAGNGVRLSARAPRVTEVLSPRNTRPAEYASIEDWGGKGFNLAQALLVGHNVPEFFVITTSAVDEGINFAEVRASCDEIRRLFPGCQFSVRSSATIEDSDKHSFAGMYESVLNRKTDAEIEEAARKVIASLHSDRVLAHKRSLGIETQEKMAVIIMRMVPNPKFSGVIYLPLPADPTVIGIDFVCDRYADKLVLGEGKAHFFDLINSPPYRQTSAMSDYLDSPPSLGGFPGLLEAIARAAEKTPGNWDIEFCVSGDKNGFYLVQQRHLTDVEPPAGFTIEEIKRTLNPDDILFEGTVTRGKTPREGIICDVIVGNQSYFLGERFSNIPFYPLGESNLLDFECFDRLHRGYAVVMDRFPQTANDIHAKTPNKGAVITVEYANRNSHIMTIIRTENPHLVYVGVELRPELLLTLQELGRVRIFADGYRSIVCKAPPEELKNPGFRLIEAKRKEREEKQEIRVKIELRNFRTWRDLIKDFEKFLESKGISEKFDDTLGSTWGAINSTEPGMSNWSIGFCQESSLLLTTVLFSGNQSEYSNRALAVFKEYFGI